MLYLTTIIKDVFTTSYQVNLGLVNKLWKEMTQEFIGQMSFHIENIKALHVNSRTLSNKTNSFSGPYSIQLKSGCTRFIAETHHPL